MWKEKGENRDELTDEKREDSATRRYESSIQVEVFIFPPKTIGDTLTTGLTML